MKPNLSRITRREMLKEAAIILGVASSPLNSFALSGKKKMKNDALIRPGDDRSFPYLEFQASTYPDLGRTIGKTFASQIKAGLSRRRDWIHRMRNFVEADMEKRYQGFIDALEKHFPHLLEELRGQAQGADVPFIELMVLNLNPELGVMMRKPLSEPDCSTIISKTPDRVILAHNEDGSTAYRDSMFVVKVRAPSGVTFLCMSYPGIIPGNAPGFNDQGIAQTCNFIASHELRTGVPRYFLDRAMLEARDLDEAVGLASHPERAYSQNHNLVSYPDKRALMVETAPSRFEVKEVDGLAFHTNHFILDGMKGVPESKLYVAASTPRYKIVKDGAKDIPNPESPQPDDLIKILSTHKGKPFAPCRHPSKIGGGCTLGCAVFDTSKDSMRLSKGNPCERKHVTHQI